jgi:hypothetical protein
MSLVKVEFTWDDSKGNCYDCGAPALYVLPDMYGDKAEITSANLMCPVCAADHAASGDGRLVHLFTEDTDSHADQEIADRYPMEDQ